MNRIEHLEAKLASRMVTGGALPGYGRNVDAIRAELARLKGEAFAAEPVRELTPKEAEAALAKLKQEDETT